MFCLDLCTYIYIQFQHVNKPYLIYWLNSARLDPMTAKVLLPKTGTVPLVILPKSGGLAALQGDAVPLHLFRKVLVVHPRSPRRVGELPPVPAQDFLDVAPLEFRDDPLLGLAERH